MTVSQKTLDAAEAALSPTDWRRAGEVHRAVDGYAYHTIRHALRALVRSGRAVRDGYDNKARYRRAVAS